MTTHTLPPHPAAERRKRLASACNELRAARRFLDRAEATVINCGGPRCAPGWLLTEHVNALKAVYALELEVRELTARLTVDTGECRECREPGAGPLGVCRWCATEDY